MITWMQRHKKWLIITIWISTIAFVGAGFVGWGQYSYGDKAGAVAKVGNVEITMGELQKSYSNLYNQYSQMFQGNFDEEKAKSFGLKSQALRQLTQQALILNLAKSYNLEISDNELLERIKTQEYFFKDGVFDKEVYKQALSRNNLTLKDYETDVKKELLIEKAYNLISTDARDSELKIINTIENIADKINYKLLSVKDINIETSDELLKSFWEGIKNSFMTEISYEIKFIKQSKISKEFDSNTINEYYNENKTHFKDIDGKILSLENAKDKITEELNAKETKKEALRAYVAYKKGTLENADVKSSTISVSNNPFNSDVITNISKLTTTSPFLKPILVGEDYYTFELVKTNPAEVKSYAEAKADVLPLYVEEQKRSKLLELAKNSVDTFSGYKTSFITATDADKLTNLELKDANEFLSKLFISQEKRGFIALENGNIVIYNILEQKLLDKTNTNKENPIVRLKSAMFNEGLIKKLQNKYKTEIFIQGL
ncbi:peptidylprolyl isomerase [Candidatus Sulfurimonas baltica]|uniref:SurA N-terminal domain-containing protein n=1 Tax=Candidatus Sulfurimonas baltica TaxID=2740404 RepID=A0A7S7RNX0_9BACT|nr:SurA N-terminal domain-containing protein [Candidatus Sulfurimonas baltica]QOY52875.1 SurA N-terminal domain-containing protein [Candidatus Sulfurimonas baltica]